METRFEQVGGHPALDFVNTVHDWHDDEPGEDYLDQYEDLVAWARASDLIGPVGQKALDAGSRRAKLTAIKDARHLRAALHTVFADAARGQALDQAALDVLTEVIRKTAAWRRFWSDGTECACGWDFDGAPPSAILGPIAWRAADLLDHGATDRIKECPPDQGCGWLFLDTSKNRSRTWCSMKTCGNQAKAKRFRERHR